MNHFSDKEPFDKEPFTPWYKEPWAWYIVMVLVTTFCWGGVQLYTAFTYQDSVVVDDYYKKGKAINLDMTRINVAKQLAIQANISTDDLIGEVRVQISGKLKEWPEQLQLSFLSPLFADQDKIITLRKSVSGEYVGQLPEQVAGRYYLQLETLDQSIPEQGFQSGWKISREVIVEPEQPIYLTAVETE